MRKILISAVIGALLGVFVLVLMSLLMPSLGKEETPAAVFQGMYVIFFSLMLPIIGGMIGAVIAWRRNKRVNK
jgi:hypothetical protein